VAAPQRKKRGGGRPRAFDDAKRRKAIELAKKARPRGVIAQLIGVHKDTLLEECKRNPEFAAAMDQAEATAHGEMIDAGLEIAKSPVGSGGGSAKAKMVMFFLTHKHWREWTPPKPDTPTPERIVGALTYLFDRLRNDLPKEHHGKIDESLHELAKLLDPQTE
jgi:hypothetical protein